MMRKSIISTAAALLLSSCLNVPDEMRVATGARPDNIDDHVRFRTTLYFRSFDYCLNKAWLNRSKIHGTTGDQVDIGDSDIFIIPGTDSLYRFRMTGKAVSGTTKVRFESGTLPANVIDPYGAVIERNEKTGRPEFVSQAELDERARRSSAKEEFDDLLQMLEQFPTEVEDSTGLKQEEINILRKAIINRMSSAMIDYAGGTIAIPTPKPTPTPTGSQDGGDGANTGEDGAAKAKDTASNREQNGDTGKVGSTQCTAGPSRRGYQIMGPEGWRTFRQDERVIMAMSSSAEPLIQSLQRTSNNVLNARASEAELVLPLVRESMKIQTVENILSDADPSTDAAVNTLIAGVKDALEE